MKLEHQGIVILLLYPFNAMGIADRAQFPYRFGWMRTYDNISNPSLDNDKESPAFIDLRGRR